MWPKAVVLLLRSKGNLSISVYSKNSELRVRSIHNGRGAMLLAAESQHYIELRKQNNAEMITHPHTHTLTHIE